MVVQNDLREKRKGEPGKTIRHLSVRDEDERRWRKQETSNAL